MQKLINSKDIQKRLKEIAKEINNKYDEITILTTLTGGVFTSIDLSKYLTIPVKFEFIKVSSYGYEQESGIVEMKWISCEKGKHLGNVLIVDDIYDTGKTMDYVIKYLKNNYTYSCIHSLVLLEKPSRHEIDLDITYIGFVILDNFVYGYGLDLKDYERNRKDILIYDGE